MWSGSAPRVRSAGATTSTPSRARRVGIRRASSCTAPRSRETQEPSRRCSRMPPHRARTPGSQQAGSQAGLLLTRARLVLDRLGAAADYALPEGGATSLYVACECGRPEVARHLVEWRADPNLKRHDGATPLLAACSGPEATRHELASLLARAGARPDPAALRYAVHSGRRGASTRSPMCSLPTHCLLTMWSLVDYSHVYSLSTHCLLTAYSRALTVYSHCLLPCTHCVLTAYSLSTYYLLTVYLLSTYLSRSLELVQLLSTHCLATVY